MLEIMLSTEATIPQVSSNFSAEKPTLKIYSECFNSIQI
jgi:hypothetical protein